jgi:hypothetical protein
MILGDVAAAVGKGLFAGLAGTAAMTLSQEIEMKFSGREPSTGPGDMVADLLGVEPRGQKEKESFSSLVHWTWGTLWGVPRGLISLAGLRGLHDSVPKVVLPPLHSDLPQRRGSRAQINLRVSLWTSECGQKCIDSRGVPIPPLMLLPWRQLEEGDQVTQARTIQ